MSATPKQREAAEFVAEAERMTNERDVDGVRDVYAPDAHWTTVLDGTVIESRGIEIWIRDDAGRVIEQHLYAFGDARPDSSVVQQLRMLVAHPLTAWAHTRARMRRSA